jgi:predicted double-glycine peptidase
VDHYVVVLEVTDDKVIVGDPFLGKRTLTHAEFFGKWEKLGITLERAEGRSDKFVDGSLLPRTCLVLR